MSDNRLSLTAGVSEVFNYALYINDISPVRGLQIRNPGPDPAAGVKLKITSASPIFEDYEEVLPDIPAGKPVALTDPVLAVRSSALAKLTESEKTQLTIRLVSPGEEGDGAADKEDSPLLIGEKDTVRAGIRILAYDQQPGPDYIAYLPAFIMPNHPVVPQLVREAADILASWDRSPSVDGYQSGDPNRVRELAAAAFEAIRARKIVYAPAPAGLWEAGQRVRTPEVVTEQHLGNCMDLTLLYAAVLEAMGLHPVLYFIREHVFAGVWLTDRCFDDIGVISHGEIMAKLSPGAEELSFVECTAMCLGSTAEFGEAEYGPEDGNLSGDNFVSLIDVRRARLSGVRPMDSRVRGESGYEIRVTEDGIRPARAALSGPPQLKDIVLTDVPSREGTEGQERIQSKQDLWESKLLDLTRRNMLLNLPKNGMALPLMSAHAEGLEDALADGEEFRILPAPEWAALPEGTSSLYESVRWPASVGDRITSEYRSHRLYSFLDEGRLAKELTSIYRAARDFRQENGVSSLYLAIGALRYTWTRESSWRPVRKAAAAKAPAKGAGLSGPDAGHAGPAADLHEVTLAPEDRDFPEDLAGASAAPSIYAPLILIPIEIVRKPANQGYALRMRDEEPRFNTTLLELIRQDVGIEVPGIDPLPSDEHGTDVRAVLSAVRGAVFVMDGWDVCETCVIGNFRFSQFALWNDIHGHEAFLRGSDVVRSLIKGYVDFGRENLVPGADNPVVIGVANADGVTLRNPAGETQEKDDRLLIPITVDESQLSAVERAAKGDTFVLHGPPGTGKSQTITGMIAALMAQGKNVLFVAEKRAALTVVEKRLTALGLDPFCLELHSDKASRKQVLTQLEKALSVPKNAFPEGYGESLERLGRTASELDEYKEHLHRKQPSGLSVREMVDRYEEVRGVLERISFDPKEAAALTGDQIASHPALIGMLLATGKGIRGIPESPMQRIGLTWYPAELRLNLRGQASGYCDALAALEDAGRQLSAAVGMPELAAREDYERAEEYAELWFKSSADAAEYAPLLGANRAELEKWYALDSSFAAKEQAILSRWTPEFLELDMDAFREELALAQKKFFGKTAAVAAVRDAVRNGAAAGPSGAGFPFGMTEGRDAAEDGYAAATGRETDAVDAAGWEPATLEAADIPAALSEVERFQIERDNYRAAFAALAPYSRAIVEAYPEYGLYRQALKQAEEIRNSASAFPGGFDALAAGNAAGTGQAWKRYQTAWRREEQIRLEFYAATECAEPDPAAGEWIQSETAFARYLIDNLGPLKDWVLYNKARQDCFAAGLKPAVEAFEHGMVPERIASAVRKGLSFALIEHAIASDPVLSSFSGASFDATVEQFKALDDLVLRLTRDEAVSLLASRVPTGLESPGIGVEVALLRKAIASGARGMSIRQLFARIPHILRKLVPCMLMSPNSVAQYLERDNRLFDVVIFDEASQIPTSRAIGALARARSAVIVGDPRQMPPTTFFMGTGPQAEDLALDDLDSILDDTLALGIPSQYLKWHYRSTHESLIAFSNHEFYQNAMVTFPSANDRERRVSMVYVNSEYGNGVNRGEAEAVVREVERRFADPELRDQSVGIVAFNIKQQAVIEDLLAERFAANPALDVWASSGEEPLFVKNLENVQGDERDVILFSIGYGPDSKGRISMNFGPINQQGGGKRLNVAFSRSKVSMIIYSSLRGSDIEVTETSPEGLKAFRDFLWYAEGRGLQENSGEAGEAGSAGIAGNIAEELRKHRYHCVLGVGRSDFRVDIGVIDPANPERYLMGILLDGQNYRDAGNTRDRELSQMSVLTRLGWKVRRIWTVDWWDNRSRVLDSLIAELDALREKAEAEAAGSLKGQAGSAPEE